MCLNDWNRIYRNRCLVGLSNLFDGFTDLGQCCTRSGISYVCRKDVVHLFGCLGIPLLPEIVLNLRGVVLESVKEGLL